MLKVAHRSVAAYDVLHLLFFTEFTAVDQTNTFHGLFAQAREIAVCIELLCSGIL